MSQDQQLVPSGNEPTCNAFDGTSMASSNGSPIVEYPEDRLGPSQDALGPLFYVYAPTIHWHIVSSIVEDEPTCKVIERLANEAYHFGQQAEEHECRLLDGQKGLEEFV